MVVGRRLPKTGRRRLPLSRPYRVPLRAPRRCPSSWDGTMTALVALVPTLVLFSGSAVLLSRTRTMAALLQLLGAACLVAVVLTHLCEAFDLFPWMGWGLPNSAVTISTSEVRCSGSRCSRSATYGTPSQSGPDPCSPVTPARTSSGSCELSSASRGTSSCVR
jgi:hypothetical protein